MKIVAIHACVGYQVEREWTGRIQSTKVHETFSNFVMLACYPASLGNASASVGKTALMIA
jgi:hypothetical protein